MQRCTTIVYNFIISLKDKSKFAVFKIDAKHIIIKEILVDKGLEV
jgi:hypothetical protein